MGKADITREYIVQKTAALFNQQGYSGTSLKDLTTATGLTKGAIYGNFANKDEVALAAFDYNFQRISAEISSRMTLKETMLEKLLVYPEFYRDALRTNFLPGGCPLLNTATEADDTHPGLLRKVKAALQFWEDSIVKLLEKGMELGEFIDSCQPRPFASLMISLIEGGVMLSKVTGQIDHINHAVDHIETLIRQLKA